MVTDIFPRGVLADYTETDDELFAHRRWDHVQFTGCIYVCQQFLVQVIHLLRCLVGTPH